MLMKLNRAQIVFLLASIVLLCHCTKAINLLAAVDVGKKTANPYSMPTTTYRALTKDQEVNEKQNIFLLACRSHDLSGLMEIRLDYFSTDTRFN